MNIDLLKQELIRDEGLRTTSYLDTEGYWTIGIGHMLGRDNKYQGLVWSLAQVTQAFQSDVANALAVAESCPTYTQLDSDTRQRAFVNMCFEMGEKLKTFQTFLLLLQQKKWKEAAADLRTTKWYHQVPVRAERICQMIATG